MEYVEAVVEIIADIYAGLEARAEFTPKFIIQESIINSAYQGASSASGCGGSFT